MKKFISTPMAKIDSIAKQFDTSVDLIIGEPNPDTGFKSRFEIEDEIGLNFNENAPPLIEQILRIVQDKNQNERKKIQVGASDNEKKNNGKRLMNIKNFSQADIKPISIFINPANFVLIDNETWPTEIDNFRERSPLAPLVNVIIFPQISSLRIVSPKSWTVTSSFNHWWDTTRDPNGVTKVGRIGFDGERTEFGKIHSLAGDISDMWDYNDIDVHKYAFYLELLPQNTNGPKFTELEPITVINDDTVSISYEKDQANNNLAAIVTYGDDTPPEWVKTLEQFESAFFREYGGGKGLITKTIIHDEDSKQPLETALTRLLSGLPLEETEEAKKVQIGGVNNTEEEERIRATEREEAGTGSRGDGGDKDSDDDVNDDKDGEGGGKKLQERRGRRQKRRDRRRKRQ